jgi:hypothetical protein
MQPPWLLPWNVPTPLAPAEGYASIPTGYEHLAQETHPAAASSFEVPARKEEQVLWSDLQDPLFGSWKHIGSGRSGFFANKYLKGIGRTALATNWARGEDAYHASGHLFASGGIREYLISVYLEAVGLGDRIVPCEAVLLRRLPEALKRGLQAHYASASGPAILPIDLELQAISVKPAGFARMSNLVWFANRLRLYADDAPACAWFAQEYALPEGARNEESKRTPDSVAAALEGAVDRTLDAFAEFFRHGVYWGSVANNFTLDGRFLDLELPTLVGRPYFGGVECAEHATNGQSAMGLALNTGDFIEAVGYLRRGVQRLQHALRVHLQDGRSTPNHGLVRDVVNALERRLSRHALFDDQAMLDRLESMFEGVLHKPSSLRQILEGEYRSWLEGIPYELPDLGLARAPLAIARTESMVESHLLVYPGNRDADWELCRSINEALRDIDQTRDLHEAVQKVNDAAALIRRRVGSVPGAQRLAEHVSA